MTTLTKKFGDKNLQNIYGGTLGTTSLRQTYFCCDKLKFSEKKCCDKKVKPKKFLEKFFLLCDKETSKCNNMILSPTILGHFFQNVFWLEANESLTMDEVYFRQPFAICGCFYLDWPCSKVSL